MAERKAPDDIVLKRVIQDSRSFADAAERLGLSKTCVRTHADRLGIRTRFRYGFEKIPQSDTVLKRMFRETRNGTGLSAVARRLGVRRKLLTEESDRVGVDGRRAIRRFLPDDETLRSDLLACRSFSDLARQYGVHEHNVRNQARRLDVPSPSKRGSIQRHA
ncbi:hypothetical protein [Methylobacterium pseudosasicola]|uniref:Uncharacterized protein n=1 Tax=Methylobacterium pseudosasicola TaxID=582667 RepID=A0A1I4NLL8_9HYPH|nr:hypothetical protein [Methylobacterium pseudosasicola]SFM16240.1 hypothetical protein SAMN05192568_102150 [Methylobacterium pseudosasicola]